MLTNSLKVLDRTELDFFQLNYVHSDPHCNSVWGRLPCCLWKGPLKRDFSDSYLITFFGVRNSTNTSAMSVIFFLKMFEI